jgi:serine/threonine-protein kinase HipA
MDRRILIYVDLDGVPILAGRLWSRVAREREGATFESDGSWLTHPNRFQREPALMLGPGPHHTQPDKASSEPSEIRRPIVGDAR